MCARSRNLLAHRLTHNVLTTCYDPEGSRFSRSVADRAESCRSGPSSGLDPFDSGLLCSCHLDSDCSCLNSQLVEQPSMRLQEERGNTRASLWQALIRGGLESSSVEVL